MENVKKTSSAKSCIYGSFISYTFCPSFTKQNGDGKIDVMELRECCLQFNLPVETELLEELIHYCDEKGEGAIDYTEFANFLNWKDKMVQNPGSADGANKSEVGTPERLNKQIDGAVGQHRTSSSRISAVVGGVSTKGVYAYRIFTHK